MKKTILAIFVILLLGTLMIYIINSYFGYSDNQPIKTEYPPITTPTSTFLLGGSLPSWIIRYDPAWGGEEGTESERQAIQKRVNEMFDIVTPSQIVWDWTEPEQGKIDFHRYEWSLTWAKEHNKDIFVAHLFWSDFRTIPEWVFDLNNEELQQAMLDRIKYVKENIGDVPRLVVMNEMLYHRYFRDRLGEDIIKQIFDETRKMFPNTQLFVNENPWQTGKDFDDSNLSSIEKGINNYIFLIQKLKNNNVDFDKIGLQLYFTKDDVKSHGGIDNFIIKTKKALDRFTKETGYPIFITEFGFVSDDEDYKAEFIKKFVTMAEDNPNIEGLIFYYWMDEMELGTALVRRDGSLTLAGEEFYNKS